MGGARVQRAWQASLDTVSFPQVMCEQTPEPAVLFSDGSCLFIKVPLLRLAGGAVIRARRDGTFEVVWSGPLPLSQQSAFRAELLSGGVAMRSHQKVRLFSDCKSFVTVAASLMAARLAGRQIPLPKANRDLWAYFCESLDGLDLACSSVTWIRSHRNYRRSGGSVSFPWLFVSGLQWWVSSISVARSRFGILSVWNWPHLWQRAWCTCGQVSDCHWTTDSGGDSCHGFCRLGGFCGSSLSEVWRRFGQVVGFFGFCLGCSGGPA